MRYEGGRRPTGFDINKKLEDHTSTLAHYLHHTRVFFLQTVPRMHEEILHKCMDGLRLLYTTSHVTPNTPANDIETAVLRQYRNNNQYTDHIVGAYYWLINRASPECDIVCCCCNTAFVGQFDAKSRPVASPLTSTIGIPHQPICDACYAARFDDACDDSHSPSPPPPVLEV
jgi:hypothetical protein